MNEYKKLLYEDNFHLAVAMSMKTLNFIENCKANNHALSSTNFLLSIAVMAALRMTTFINEIFIKLSQNPEQAELKVKLMEAAVSAISQAGFVRKSLIEKQFDEENTGSQCPYLELKNREEQKVTQKCIKAVNAVEYNLG